jgi:membrane fusion protein, heavy metal efflux system
VNGTSPSGWGRTIAVAVVCFALGGATVYFVNKRPADHVLPAGATAAPGPSMSTPTPSTPGAIADVTVPVPPELAQRAGIQTTTVGSGPVSAMLRVPGTVTPNQYQQVQVSSLVGGQITQVSAQLGDRVRKGMPLAQIFSSDLADAQTRYLSVRGELAAADERLQRTTRLVAIGAASQQELEQTQAERTKLATNVEGEAARLQLFGMTSAAVTRLKSAADISASLRLSSPADGVVTERTANPGAVVTPSVPLFVISSLSPVWVIAEVAERDLARVRVGATATVAMQDSRAAAGKISYISPDIRVETRTAQVRVETPNPDGRLRFGMLVSVEVPDAGGGETASPSVPDGAVQSIAGRSFVYLVPQGRQGEFVEREVTTGARAQGAVEIVRGLSAGDVVVTTGSFYIRAERERLGLRQPPSSADPHSGQVRTIDVAVTAAGFAPAKVEVAAGTHVKLRVTRQVESTCGTDLVVAGKKVVDQLPLNKPVEVDLGLVTRGEVAFTCGMGMLKGSLVVF